MIRALFAGSWYPTGAKLENMITSAMEKARVEPSEKLLKAIIVPHAGYVYCLGTAAYSYKAINPELYDRVIVIGPSHREAFANCRVIDGTEVETPLGNIPID